MKLRIVRTETCPLNPKNGDGDHNGTFSVVNINYFQNIHKVYLIPLGTRSVIFIISVWFVILL